ncbi:MAG: hypothetical protein BWY25_02515 [Chloroflexi bacterium ADurb.Bin222]|nr:MAG: hypothetical protein BWY25_02515 [Chloroflexi bacterium ADurb.Bin222]
MFLRHTTANENDAGAWERGHLSTDSIFRGGMEWLLNHSVGFWTT